MAKTRKAKVRRKTRETDIQVSLNIDGKGTVNFFAHMFYVFNEVRKCKGLKTNWVILIDNNN